MDTHFEGIRFDGQYSFYQHDNGARSEHHRRRSTRAASPIRRGSVADGGTCDATVAFGAAFDDGRGHVMRYAGYREHRPGAPGPPRLQRLRAQASTAPRCSGGPLSPAAARRPRPTGRSFSTTTAPRQLYQFGANRTAGSGLDAVQFRAAEPLPAAGRALYGRRVRRIMRSRPASTPYLEFMFMDDRTVAQIAPSGDFGNTLVDQLRQPAAVGPAACDRLRAATRTCGCESGANPPAISPRRPARFRQPGGGRGPAHLLSIRRPARTL